MSQTVLVADDSQTIRKVVQMALKASDYEVVGVGSAREAVEAAKQQPSVILLDYFMPDGSGYDVCRAIKQDNATSNIPVIMLGGTYKEFDAGQARSSGASKVVMKPFKTDELMGAIDTAVNQAAQAPAPAAAQQPGQQQRQPSSQPQQPSSQPQQPAPQQPQPTGSNPGQTPVPESQPRIPLNSGTQSRAPSGSQAGSQPRIPGSGSTPGTSMPDSSSSARQRQPTPIPASGSGAAPMPMSREEIKDFVRSEIKDAVREELPGMLRNVMGEIFQKKVLPKLVKHSEQKIQQTLDQNLDEQVTRRVRLELERLLNEE